MTAAAATAAAAAAAEGQAAGGSCWQDLQSQQGSVPSTPQALTLSLWTQRQQRQPAAAAPRATAGATVARCAWQPSVQLTEAPWPCRWFGRQCRAPPPALAGPACPPSGHGAAWSSAHSMAPASLTRDWGCCCGSRPAARPPLHPQRLSRGWRQQPGRRQRSALQQWRGTRGAAASQSPWRRGTGVQPGAPAVARAAAGCSWSAQGRSCCTSAAGTRRSAPVSQAAAAAAAAGLAAAQAAARRSRRWRGCTAAARRTPLCSPRSTRGASSQCCGGAAAGAAPLPRAAARLRRRAGAPQ
jgi:hypothetical protein